LRIKSVSQLQAFLTKNKEDVFILGGGSNILLTGDIERPVLKNEIKERTVIRSKNNKVLVRAGGGENWHRFVRWCVKSKFAGLENLSLIPGSVGAAPMQNIGAYGVELKDVFYSLEAVHLRTGKLKTFKKAACKFGYRTSVFKTNLKDKYFICSVTFELSLEPKLNLSYGAIQKLLDDKNIMSPSIDDVSKVVMEIRRSKLPDPKLIGNAGSFFKNPVVSTRKANALKKKNPAMPFYPNNAKPKDLVILADRIRESVRLKFGIEITPEVNLIK